MINVEDYSKDIKAVEEEINLLNMITEAKIDRFSKVDYLSEIGKYKVNVSNYRMGLAEILVNRNNHKVIGLYGKTLVSGDKSKIIGTKLNMATECIIIEVLNKSGTVIKSINTNKNINTFCMISDDFVTIGDDKFVLN